MIKKLTLLSILLAIPLKTTAANPPQSFIQPSIFLPVFKFFFIIAIIILGIAFILAILLKKFSPQYKDRSLSSIVIDFIDYLFSNKKQKHRSKEGFTSTYSDEYPYERKNLLEKSEKNFYKALETAVLNKYHIYPQVGLSRIINVEKSIKNNKQGHLNRILQKSVDFVICDKKDFSTLLVIELDGESHNTKDQQESDDFKNKALSKAGINLIRHIVQPTYNTEQLKETLRRYIDLEIDDHADQPKPPPAPHQSTQKEKIYTSPGCYGTMKNRTGKDGKKYWVCSEYNKCKTAMIAEEAGDN